LIVTIAGENVKLLIDTASVATGASEPDAPARLPAAGIDMPGIIWPAITGGGTAAPAAVVGPPQPAKSAAPAVAAAITILVPNWRMVIDPSPLADPADAGLINR
jgi:hypothetical protein